LTNHRVHAKAAHFYDDDWFSVTTYARKRTKSPRYVTDAPWPPAKADRHSSGFVALSLCAICSSHVHAHWSR